eukprot:TRINITY_DN26232_c0_g1_i3.p1 TRINITY_DN26232_c0_g1~~TRINITY_DN26232_c0_g1_i3.p1  ORF type:complete len:357 (-),score=63.18 TRINITY_DN26232_c0_g1_i3:208-1278(-)
MIRRPPRSTLSSSSAASDVYKRQGINAEYGAHFTPSSACLRLMSAESTPTGAGSPVSMEILTPRIEALRSSLTKNFESSVNRKVPRKASIENADRDHRRALVEGLVTARSRGKDVPRRGSVGNLSDGSYVSTADFDSFKRTIEARFQSLEEALEQKDEEIDALQTKLSSFTGGEPVKAPSPPPRNTTAPKLSGVPSLNLGTPISPSTGKKLPKAPPSPSMSPVSSNISPAPSGACSGLASQWKPEEAAIFLAQLGVFKLWTASMVCRVWRTAASGVVLNQKREQLQFGAGPAMEFHAANPGEADGLAALLPPLFQPGGPYHTLGCLGFTKIQELLKDDNIQLKHLYKFMRDITRRK